MTKKLITLFIFSVLTSLILVGCGASEMKDGTYTAEDLNYDDHGWKASVTINVSNGKISNVNFDYTKEDGSTKSNNPEYGQRMLKEVGITPDEYLKEYENSLIQTQNPEKVEAVSGATVSLGDFKSLAKAAMDAALSGNTNTVTIELIK